jgi:hypothetical protein
LSDLPKYSQKVVNQSHEFQGVLPAPEFLIMVGPVLTDGQLETDVTECALGIQWNSRAMGFTLR